MELQKGRCFCCNATKIINVKSDFLLKVFTTLFQDNVLNVKQNENLIVSLRLCPACYYKIDLLLKTTHRFSSVQSDKKWSCFLCNSNESTIKIKNWQYFLRISEDFTKCGKEEESFVCLECFFYLDMRNLIKEQLLSKYPKLTSHMESTVIKPIKIKRVSLRKQSVKNIDLSHLEKLKPLKSDRALKKLNFVYNDPKLFSQVPYTLLQTSNVSQINLKHKITSPKSTNSFFKIKLKPSTKKLSQNILKISKVPLKLKKPPSPINLSSSLVIKIPQLDLNASVHNDENDIDTQEQESTEIDKSEYQNKENTEVINGKLDKSDTTNKIHNENDETTNYQIDFSKENNGDTEERIINSAQKCDKDNGIENHNNGNNIELNLSREKSPESDKEQSNLDKSVDNNIDAEKETEDNVHINNERDHSESEENKIPSSNTLATEEIDTNSDTEHLSGNESEKEDKLNQGKDINNDFCENKNETEQNDDLEKSTINSLDSNDTFESTESETMSRDNDSEENAKLDEDINLKRKRSEDTEDTSISPDKKKKKVTFSDDA